MVEFTIILALLSELVLKFASEYDTSYVTGPVLVSVVDGAPIVTTGGVLSMITVAAGADAVELFPALSETVPAGTVKLKVPSPIISLNVTGKV